MKKNDQISYYDMEEIIKEMECTACGMRNCLEAVEGDGNYRCAYCGYEGNIEDDIAAESYFWDEALFNYDEDEIGECFDNDW